MERNVEMPMLFLVAVSVIQLVIFSCCSTKYDATALLTSLLLNAMLSFNFLANNTEKYLWFYQTMRQRI